jgi:hypothetical protein
VERADHGETRRLVTRAVGRRRGGLRIVATHSKTLLGFRRSPTTLRAGPGITPGRLARLARLPAHSLPDEAPLGAYGLRLLGVEPAGELLVAVAPDAPSFTLEAEIGRAASPYERVDDEQAALRLRNGGAILIDRRAGRVRFRVPHAVRADELVHPYLAPAAAVIGRWQGWESMHAGAFEAGGRVWALLGERESGKSSTLAWLAAHGFPAICDDMLVLDGLACLPGPRSVDLRRDAAERLGAGTSIGVTGARERWRIRVPAEARSLPLGGWFFLEWGDRLDARSLSGAERLDRLIANRGVRLPPTRPEALVDLAAVPGWALQRPAAWDTLPATAERLLELTGV